jgi:hypothetical protein
MSYRSRIQTFLAGALTLALSGSASALPGFFAGKDSTARKSATTQIVLLTDGAQTTVTVLPEYQGPNQPFVLAMPVPGDVDLKEVKTVNSSIRSTDSRLTVLTSLRSRRSSASR